MKRCVAVAALFAASIALAQPKEADKPEKPKGDAPNVEKMPFTPEAIRKVVTYHQPQIQACYEEMMANTEKVAEGKILTSWVITPDGLVKNAKVEKKSTTLKDPKLHECVVAVLSAMTFPKPPKAQDHPIEYPFNLKAIK